MKTTRTLPLIAALGALAPPLPGLAQNFAAVGSSLSQLAQRGANGLPHSGQNLERSEL